MSGLNIFVVGLSDKFGIWTIIVETAKSMDKYDFMPNGYFIDETKFSRKLVSVSTPTSSKRKGKSAWDQPYTPSGRTGGSQYESIDLSFDIEGEDDELDVDDIPDE